MRKLKILSSILIFMLLINTILPVAKAVLAPPEENIELEEPYEIITEDDVIKDNVYMILGLEYEVYDASQDPENLGTPKAGKAYNANDFIKVKLRIKEKKNFEKVVSCLYYIHYDKAALKLESLECGKTGYNDNSELEYGFIAYQFGGSAANATMDDIVTELVFKAKKDSNPDAPTTISIYDGDFSDKNKANAVEVKGNINTPQLTLPEPNSEMPETITHGIEITKVDENDNPITTSNAIYRITMPNGEVKLVQTNEGRALADGKLLLEGLPMPTGALDNTYNYLIEEVAAPEGYILDRTQKILKVKFEDNGNIEVAKLAETVQNVNENNIIELKFSNQKEEEKPQGKSQVNFVINKKDENGNLITTDEASFGLEVATGDVRYVTTSSGTITKSLDIPEDISNEIEYKLNEISAPYGYILDGQDIKFKVNYSENDDKTIRVTSVTKISGTNATISSSGNTITIDVKNEKIKPQEKFQIEITKVDEAGNPIENSATFLVTTPNGNSQIGQTGANGKMIIQSNIPQGDLEASGYTYKIQEIKAPSGYKLNADEISINLTFQDVEGVRKLISAEVTGDQAVKQEITNNTLPLNIVNEKEPENFTITLNKVNEQGNIIAKPNVYFKLTKPNGEVVAIQTDATGKVIYTGKMPEIEKEETYKLQEIVAPDGYVLNSNEQIIKLNFRKVSGVMKLVNASVSEPVSIVGEIINNNLTINFKNEIEVPTVQKTQFDLSVTKVDKETGTPITGTSAIFQLFNENGTVVGLFETDNSGMATIKVDLPSDAKTINYKLVEKVAPNGYVIDAAEKTLSIEFINNSGVIVVNSINVNGTNVRAGATDNTSANVIFENELIPPIEEPKTYEFIINKKDTQDLTKNILEENVTFIVTAPDGSSQTLRTDALGKISITCNIPKVAGTYTYEIEEIKAPLGYTLYGTPQYVDIVFGSIDGVMQITSASVRGDKINKDFAGVNSENDTEVIVSVLNDKYVPVVDEKFTLNINKVDEELKNILQQDVYFKLEAEGDTPQLVATNANGIAEFIGTVPKEAKTIVYKLTEITGPNGYIKNENDMTLNLIFTEVSGKIKLTDITVNEAQGVRKIGNVQNNTADIQVINKKELEPEPEEPIKPEKDKFTLGIKKIDAETLEYIKQEGIIFKVENDKQQYDFYGTDDKGIAKATFEMPDTAGTYTYYILETVAPVGYTKNPNRIAVKATFVESNGKIVLEKFEIEAAAGARVVEEVLDGHIGYVEILNTKIKEEPARETWSIELDKVNSETLERIKQAGVVFKITNVAGKSSYLETDADGKILLTYFMPDIVGKTRYEIEEIVAPDGYKLYGEPQTLEVTFEEVDGEIVITDAQVIGNKITSTYGTKKVTLSVLNDKLADVPDKPDSNKQPTKPDTAPGKIPQTGYFDLGIVLIVVMFGVTAIVLIKYYKYKKIK